MEIPILVERFADNGGLSHHDLVDANGTTLWTGDPEGWEGIEKRERHRGMTQGIALSVNYLLRGENAQSIWSSGGMTIRECIASQVDVFDLDRLIPEFAKEEDAEAIAGYYSKMDDEEHAEHKINAEEFLLDLNDHLRDKGEMVSALGADEFTAADIALRIEGIEESITYAKEAYIHIVRTQN